MTAVLDPRQRPLTAANTGTRSQRMRSRLRWLQSFTAVAAAALCARLCYLQIWQAPRLSGLARAQRTRTLNLAALRDEIVDRNGVELAVSENAWSLYVQPQDFKQDPAATAAKLAPIVGEDPAKLQVLLAGHHWAWLAREIDLKEARQIRALKIPGMGLVSDTKRVYPNGELAATLLGFVGVDNQGLAGIEHDFDSLLRGPARTLTIQVDAKGNEILRDARENPMLTMQSDVPKVQLTLDAAIEHEAERLLGDEIAAVDAASGTVIVMNPRNGDVLAFATLPSYDPNSPETASPSVTTNRGVSSVFEPGSIMKPFTLAAALQSGVITPRSVFACPPRLKVGKESIGDHDPPPGVRHLTPAEILKVSSNVGAGQIGLRMPASLQRSILVSLGFGCSTDSGLGGESPGILPKLPWRPINHVTISYGQGVSVTALQLATAECVLANGGFKVRPRFISQIVSANGRVLRDFPPDPPRRIFSSFVVRELVPMLVGVTSDGGTGPAARIPGYDVAGKTGTAQRVLPNGRGYSADVVSSFLGFVPAENPRIVVLTSLDSPKKAHFASETAAPLFRDVAAAALRVLGTEPTASATTAPAH
ncbi:MAG: penicillin-binding protein 2 [Cyanobacteria bacterium REEB65]|nr:penicillin-binding protein 2 [Cyanobacteria bacterium REEB65]